MLRHYFGDKVVPAKQRLLKRAVDLVCEDPSSPKAADNLRKARDYVFIMKETDSEAVGRAIVKLREVEGQLPKGHAIAEDVSSTITYFGERFPELGEKYGLKAAGLVQEAIQPIPVPTPSKTPISSFQSTRAGGVIPESLPKPLEIPLPGLVVLQDLEAPGFGSAIVLDCFDDNGEAVAQISARRPKISIGRTMQSNIIISDMSVSRQHAQIEISEKGASITDLSANLGSDNGTFINETRLSRHMVDLHEADSIKIGPVTFNVKRIIPKVAGRDTKVKAQSSASQEVVHEQADDAESLKAMFRMPRSKEESNDAMARLSAIVDKLEDNEALFYVSMYSEDDASGAVAVTKLDDTQTLMSIALLSSNKGAMEAAVRKLADAKQYDIVLHIAEHGPGDIAKLATSMLPSADEDQTTNLSGDAIPSRRSPHMRRFERVAVKVQRNAESIEQLVQFVESMNNLPNNLENIQKAKERLAKGFEDVMRESPWLVTPKYSITLSGKHQVSYAFADFFTDGHDRPMALTYIANSQGEVRIAITYLSSSQAAWRLLTDISQIYGKGKLGEHTITFPLEVQQELDLRYLLRIASKEQMPVQKPASIILNAFEDGNFHEKKMQIEQTYLMNAEKPEDMPEVENNRKFVGMDGRPVKGNDFWEKVVQQVNPVDYDQIESFLHKIPMWLPKFERGSELIGDAYSPLYGNFKRAALPSSDGRLRYVFNVTAVGTFLAAIESPLAEITKYGTISWVPVKLFPEHIMTPPVEYQENMAHLCLECGEHFKGNYYYVRNHHNRISLFRDASDFFGYLEGQVRRENGGLL